MVLIYKVEIHNGGTWFCSREVSRSPRQGGGGGGGARGGGGGRGGGPPGNDDDGPGGGGGSPNTEGRHGPGGRGGACDRDVGGVSPAAGTPPAGDRGPAGGGAGDRDVGGNAAGAGAPPAGAPPAETGAPPAIVCELGSSNGVAIQTDPLMGLREIVLTALSQQIRTLPRQVVRRALTARKLPHPIRSFACWPKHHPSQLSQAMDTCVESGL